MPVRDLFLDEIVSIHAHQFPGGRPWCWAVPGPYSVFQSTPTSFPVGDGTAGDRYAGDWIVSIHAHQFPGGRPMPVRDLFLDEIVSIHAHQFPGGRLVEHRPLVEQRVFQSTPTSFPVGDSATAQGCWPSRCFNPRPPVSRWATSTPASGTAGFDVSIHAHQFPGGRPMASDSCPASATFQSTPTSFPVGDLFPCPLTPAHSVFQSTPTSFPVGDSNPPRPLNRF